MSSLDEEPRTKRIKCNTYEQSEEKIIFCSEINDFSFNFPDGKIISCNGSILSDASEFFRSIIMGGDMVERTNDIPINDYSAEIVEEVISHQMFLGNKKVEYIMKPCSLDSAEQQLQFCLQYQLEALEKKLLSLCKSGLSSFGKFTPTDMIRIGIKHNDKSIIKQGITMFNIDTSQKDAFIAEINKNNHSVSTELITQMYNNRDYFRDRYEKIISFVNDYKPVDDDSGFLRHYTGDSFEKFKAIFQKTFNTGQRLSVAKLNSRTSKSPVGGTKP
jgi:hypothetical protein